MIRRAFFKFLPAAAAALPKVVEVLATKLHDSLPLVMRHDYNVYGISEATYPQWKPHRLPSESIDHPEITAHFERLALKLDHPGLPDDFAVACQPGDVLKELGCELDQGLITIHSGVIERVGPGDVLHAISDGEHYDDRGFSPTV